MNGYLMLTEARSGSSWLGSLTNASGAMGNSSEWLSEPGLRDVHDGTEFFSRVLSKASTPNGCFAVKIFPRHLYETTHKYGFDFIRRCMAEHDTKIIVLFRKDRVRQAISLARASITRQWGSRREAEREPKYDFNFICRCYFFIDQSYAFWRSYLELLELPHDTFFYEDLVPDPAPFIQSVSSHMGIKAPETPQSEFRIQRDNVTEEWVLQFRKDLAERNVLSHGFQRLPGRNVRNLARFLRKDPMLPLPFTL
ncbi:MAG: Stf0 family sulfotransferase [Hyphomicrobiales bacterium]|nr:Stf0 family sulfotransferase [Hyphomicrobiales bacterium]